MADRTAADAYGGMFRMVANRKQPNKALAKVLWRQSQKYDFTPDQMMSAKALRKLGISFENQDAYIEDEAGRKIGIPTPRAAFARMKRVFERDVREGRESDSLYWANQSADFSAQIAEHAAAYGLPKSAVQVNRVVAKTQEMPLPGPVTIVDTHPPAFDTADAPPSLTSKIIIGLIVATGVFLMLNTPTPPSQ